MQQIDRAKVLRDERRGRGECPRYGAPINAGDGHVYCAGCRAYRNERARILRAQRKREAEIAELRRGPETCRTCYWARRDGDRIFCPSARGTCIRRDMLLGPETEPEQDE